MICNQWPVTRRRRLVVAAAFSSLVLSARATAQHPGRAVSFTTTEGPWVSLDVSPDGRTIVFDLLGDLYTVPIAGGQSTRITSSTPLDAMPRWSPDGQWITFSSDRNGGADLWIVHADGSGARAIATQEEGALISPVWTHDGRFVIAAR